MNPQPVVAIVSCPDYSASNVQNAVEKAAHLAELSDVFDGTGTALLKPNLLSTRPPEHAVTTHPAVVEAIGLLAQRSGRSLLIGDSPPFVGENPSRYARLIKTTGMADCAMRLNARVVRFEEDSVNIPHPSGRIYKSFEFAREVVDADVLVNIAKLKTHGLTTLTGAVKNVFGCVPGIRKGLFHVQSGEDKTVFAQMLVDLLAALQPRINIMDAVDVMEGEGPSSGKPRRLGAILASSDPVALDAVAAAIAGIDPLSIDTTRLAWEQGLGCGDISAIEIRGEAIDSVGVSDFALSSGSTEWSRMPGPLRSLLRRHLVARPAVNAKACTGCGDCATVCPVNAINNGRPARVNLSECIRCYCCAEVCNYNAMDLQPDTLGRLLKWLTKR